MGENFNLFSTSISATFINICEYLEHIILLLYRQEKKDNSKQLFCKNSESVSHPTLRLDMLANQMYSKRLNESNQREARLNK